ncbi:hypothetical protein HK102_004242, partial [Quaeritorhiza haematococci]
MTPAAAAAARQQLAFRANGQQHSGQKQQQVTYYTAGSHTPKHINQYLPAHYTAGSLQNRRQPPQGTAADDGFSEDGEGNGRSAAFNGVGRFDENGREWDRLKAQQQNSFSPSPGKNIITGFPDSEDDGSEFVDDDFKKLVDQLDNEEFTQFESRGGGGVHDGYGSPSPTYGEGGFLDGGNEDDGQGNHNGDRVPTLNGFATSRRFMDVQPDGGVMMSGDPSIQLHEEELDELDQDASEGNLVDGASQPQERQHYGYTREPINDFSRLEGLTNLELTELDENFTGEGEQFDPGALDTSISQSGMNGRVESEYHETSELDEMAETFRSSLRGSLQQVVDDLLPGVNALDIYDDPSVETRPTHMRSSQFGRDSPPSNDPKTTGFDGNASTRSSTYDPTEMRKSHSKPSTPLEPQHMNSNHFGSLAVDDLSNPRNVGLDHRPRSASQSSMSPGGSRLSSNSTRVPSRDQYHTTEASIPTTTARTAAKAQNQSNLPSSQNRNHLQSSVSSVGGRRSVGNQGTPHMRYQNNNVDMRVTTPSGPVHHDMLIEARNEIHSLRALNERLLVANEEYKKSIDALAVDKENAIDDLRASFEHRLQIVQKTERETQADLERRIRTLQEELQNARQVESHISSIRANLQQEKELDVLTIKKEVLSQKERQLQDIRRELAKEKEELSRKLCEDMQRQQDGFAREKEEMVAERERTRNALAEREAEIGSLREQLQAAQEEAERERQRGVQVSDACIQSGETFQEAAANAASTSALLSRLQTDLQTQGYELERLLGALETLFGVSLAGGRSQLDDTGHVRAVDSDPVNKNSTLPQRVENLLSRCHQFTQNVQQSIERFQAEITNRDEAMSDLKESHERDVVSKVQEVKSSLEQEHHQSLQLLRSAHSAEISSLRENYEAQLANVRNDLQNDKREREAQVKELSMQLAGANNAAAAAAAAAASAIAKAPLTPSSTSAYHQYSLEELVDKFPTQIAQYRTIIEKETRDRIDSIETAHKRALNELNQRQESERAEREQKYRQDLQQVTSRLKEQCASAYEAAVRKLKGEYVKLEQKLADKFAGELEVREREIRERYEREMEEVRREVATKTGNMAAITAEAQASSASIEADYRQKLVESELKAALSQKDQEQEKAVLEVKQRYGAAQRDALEKMKLQYISTLRMMRDDVAASKSKGLERLESQWTARKEKLDAEWNRRMEEVVARYETQLQRLSHKNNTRAGSRPISTSASIPASGGSTSAITASASSTSQSRRSRSRSRSRSPIKNKHSHYSPYTKNAFNSAYSSERVQSTNTGTPRFVIPAPVLSYGSPATRDTQENTPHPKKTMEDFPASIN